MELGYRDLEALAVEDVQSVIECAGSGGRDLFGAQQGAPVAGTPWKLGGIGAARWRGVPLRTVLELAGVKDEAVDVMAHGLDDPYICDGIDHGPVRRPLPVGKALDDVLVAFEMNGDALPPDHGFPARLVVPGWVGVASVKWLGALEVSDRRLWSPWNTRWYAGLTAQPVKSAFELPWEATLEAGRCTTLTGRAWSGGAAIAGVDASTDGGDTWQRARLRGPNRRNVWARFELEWIPTPAATSCSPGRPTWPARASPTPCRRIHSATSSGRSCATR